MPDFILHYKSPNSIEIKTMTVCHDTKRQAEEFFKQTSPDLILLTQPEKVNPLAYDFYYGKILESALIQIQCVENACNLPSDKLLSSIDEIVRKILSLKGC